MSNPFFLDIAPALASDPSSPYAVLPLPYERTVTYGTGTRNGPEAILRASHETEDFDEELRIPLDLRVQTLPAPECDDTVEAAALDTIRARALDVVGAGRFLLSLGGEHTVTVPLVEATRSVCDNLCVLHLDAHADLRDEYQGNRLSHACVMRRIRDTELRTVHVGIRSVSADEHRYMDENSLPVFWAADLTSSDDRSWVDTLVDQLTEHVYITVDIDCFDPSIAPGTGTPEPGGLNWYQVTRLLRGVFTARNVVAADICETAPVGGSQVTESLAARLGQKLLVYHKHRDSL